MDTYTKLTIKDTNITPVQLASFLKKILNNNGSLQYYLELSKKLLAGEEYIIEWDIYLEENDIINITKFEVLDNYDIAQQKREEEYKRQEALRKRGANGDADAAIEFCQNFDPNRYMAIAYAAYG